METVKMKPGRSCESARQGGGLARLTLLGIFCGLLGMVVLLPSARGNPPGGRKLGEQDQGGAGVILNKQATAKDVGLPLYPGAKPHKDEKEDSPSVQMGLWGSSFGFKLAVLKMDSNDVPEKIAEFYKKALAKYGPVLNCSEPSARTDANNDHKSSNRLDCDDDKPEKGGLLFKAGTKEKQHIVGIQPNGQGSLFQLIYVEARGSNKDNQAL
jgi:hypothetical protein